MRKTPENLLTYSIKQEKDHFVVRWFFVDFDIVEYKRYSTMEEIKKCIDGFTKDKWLIVNDHDNNIVRFTKK